MGGGRWEMRDEGRGLSLLFFCGVGDKNLSADRDEGLAFGALGFWRQAQDGREPGVWSRERRARLWKHRVAETSDGQTIRRQILAVSPSATILKCGGAATDFP